jgi:P-type E1-E2 ATPase
LEQIAGVLGKWAYFSAFIIFVSQCLYFLIKNSIVGEGRSMLELNTLIRILDFFTTAIAIVIVAVPEGLPLAVSLSLAFSMDSMKKDNLLVKNIEAVETMGMVDSICTGKTATLTNNYMNV